MSLKALGKDTVVYGIGGAFTRFIALFSFPLYAGVLSDVEFARQDLVLSYFSALIVISGLGLDNGYARLFYEKGEEYAARLAANALYPPLIFAALLACVTWFLRAPLANHMFDDPKATPLLGIGCIFLLANVATRPHQLTFRLKRQPILFAIHAGCTALSQFALIWYFVRVKALGAFGVLLASSVGAVCSFLIAVSLCGWLGKCLPSWNRGFARQMLNFGLPLLFSGMALWLMDSSTKFLVQHYAGAGQTALFGVGQRIGNLLGLLLFGFQLGWAPIAFSMMNDPERAARFYARVAHYYWALLAWGVTVIGLFAPEIIVIVSKLDYVAASKFVPILSMAALLWGFIYIVSIGYQYAKKTWHQLVGLGLGGLTMLIVAVVFGPIYGAAAVAVSVLLGYSIAVVYCIWASNRYLQVAYSIPRMVVAAVIALLVPIGSTLTSLKGEWSFNATSFAIRCIVTVATAGVFAIVCLPRVELVLILKRSLTLISKVKTQLASV